MDNVKVTVGTCTKEYQEGVTFEVIARDFKDEFKADIAVAVYNGKLRELSKCPEGDGVLEFMDMTSGVGHRTYKRTAVLLFMKACNDCITDKNVNKIKLEFSLNTGYYFSCDGIEASEDLAKKIQTRMQELVDKNAPILKFSKGLEDAKEIFKLQGMEDKLKLCKFRHSSVINVYNLEGYMDYYYGHMLPSCGYIKKFEVLTYKNGFILNLPRRKTPDVLDEYVPFDKVFDTMMEATEWNDMLGIDNVGDLNEKICSGELYDLVLVQEALQERKISEIAKDIASRDGVKFVMIAGPSSSGKTSFSFSHILTSPI